MPIIVSINQPAYLPWLGYFHRIAISDLHIVLDHVQFEKNSFTNRNKLRSNAGWQWLTVPVKTKGRFGNLNIHQLEIDNSTNWAQKHWKALQFSYARAPFFAQHAPSFEEIYSQEWHYLIELIYKIIRYLLQAFEIKTPLAFSSEMKVESKKDELILNLCRAVGAEVYISGPLGRNYLREQMFQEAGIRVVYHDYNHPTYPQVYPGFGPYLSAIDLLFNCGPKSLEILMRDQGAIIA